MTTATLATLFIHAIELSGRERLMLMWPLCLSVALVYKTTRCENLRAVPRAVVVLWGTIVLGMYVVGLTLWALYGLMA